jgi:hypothetical protein
MTVSDSFMPHNFNLSFCVELKYFGRIQGGKKNIYLATSTAVILFKPKSSAQNVTVPNLEENIRKLLKVK